MQDRIKEIGAELDAAKQKTVDTLTALFEAEATRLLEKYPQFSGFKVGPYGECFLKDAVDSYGRRCTAQLEVDDAELPEECNALLKCVIFAYTDGIGRDGEVELYVYRTAPQPTA
jgi:hypothetical protein